MITPVPPAYSIGKSIYRELHKEIPGPGDYNTEKYANSTAQFYSFSKSPRKIHNFSPIPGPGVYNPQYLSGSQGFSLSKSPRKLTIVRTNSPGPGEYDYYSAQQRYKLSINKARNRSNNLSDVPGPGHYSPSMTYSTESPRKVGFLKQQRMPKDTFLTPSPGKYSLPSVSSGPCFSIPKSILKPRISPSPGPGVYEIPSTIGLASKKK
jgi:hypothetical protein